MSGNGGRTRTEDVASVPSSGPVEVRELDGPEEVAAAAGPDPVRVVEQLLSVAIGIASLALGAVVARVGRSEPDGTAGEPEERSELRSPPDAPGGVVLRTTRWSARAGTSAVRSITVVTSAVAGASFRAAGGLLDGRLAAVGARARSSRTSFEAAASAFLNALVPDLVRAIADRVDLTQLVLDRVDLDRIVASLDLRALAARLPVDVIAEGIDVDAVASRLDVDALVRRLDVSSIAIRVIDDIDLPELIRESTGDLGSEAVDTIRFKSMNADRRLFRWRDRHFTHDGSLAAPSSDGGAP